MGNQETLFTKIINRDIPAEIIYEDDLCLAFKDINPQAPLHALLIPKQVITKLSDSSSQDQAILGHLMLKAPFIAKQQGYADAFRLVINNGEAAGQTVFHLHIHIIAGRELSWPPG
ncbi:MAG: histidine triad nucleotide-binding protein [Gammaproteobacteria bacterium]|nr:histidine triad nucleotide-binding protein [Gammaproteobacteria bacterium]